MVNQPPSECNPTGHRPGLIDKLRRHVQHGISLKTTHAWEHPTDRFFILTAPTDDRSRNRLYRQMFKEAEIHGDRMGIEIIKRNPFIEQAPFPSRFIVR